MSILESVYFNLIYNPAFSFRDRKIETVSHFSSVACIEKFFIFRYRSGRAEETCTWIWTCQKFIVYRTTVIWVTCIFFPINIKIQFIIRIGVFSFFHGSIFLQCSLTFYITIDRCSDWHTLITMYKRKIKHLSHIIKHSFIKSRKMFLQITWKVLVNFF